VKLPPLILASASPRRSELLRQLCGEFQVIPSNAAETESEALSPGEMSQLNAYRKARAISKKHPDSLVIGMDTVVALDDAIFNKPASLPDARRSGEQIAGCFVARGVVAVEPQREPAEHRLDFLAEEHGNIEVSIAIYISEFNISKLSRYNHIAG